MAEINSADRQIIKKLLDSSFLDDTDDQAIFSMDKALMSDYKLISKRQDDNEKDRIDALENVDSMMEALKSNLENLEKIRSSSDLASDSSNIDETQSRIDELKTIRALLEGEVESKYELRDSQGDNLCVDKSINEFKEQLKVKDFTTPTGFDSVMGLSIEDGTVAHDFIGAVYSRYNISERTSRAVFDYVIKNSQITIKTIDADVEHYDPRDRSLHLDIKYDETDSQGRGAGYFHEFGHAMDHALGGSTYLSSDDNFLEALKKDYNEILVRFNAGPQKAKKFLSFLENPVAYPISDLLEGLSNGAISGGYGHMEGDIDYWKNKYAVCNEAFAHFFEASMGSPERLKYIKLVFPNAYDQYQKMIVPFVSKERDELERER